MAEPTPIRRERDSPFLYLEVQPTPGRAPRLDLGLATTHAALDSYSSQHAPTGLLAHRIRRGDLGALDDLVRALVTVAPDEARDVGHAYGSIVAELLREPPLLAPLSAWLARCLADDGLPAGVRAGLAKAIASDPRIPPEPTLDALFASRLVDPPPPSDTGVPIGQGLVFDTETDAWPNRHDHLLRRLAGLVAPALDEVLFEEVPHVESEEEDDDDDDDDDTDPDQLRDAYRLRAFLPDCTFEIVAGDRSDWLDVPAVLGLLNTLCEALGLDVRFVALPTDSQDAHVIAAPAHTILRALADGSLVLADAAAAAASGRAYEHAALAAILARRR